MTLLPDTVTRAGERTNAGTRRRNGAGSLFGENGSKKITEGQHERKALSTSATTGTQAGRFPLPMTPAQRKRATALIRRECCNCDGGNCLALDDGDTCACPQMITFSVCCKWLRWAVLPLDRTLEAEIYRDSALKRCSVCGKPYVPKSNRGKYCPDCAARVHRRQKAVNTLRELQYAGLVEIQKQGCRKSNRIYPKSYEAVPNTDFKKSGCGTPEG